MIDLEVRGERQWAAAVAKAARVERLRVEGPASLALTGIERMTNLREASFPLGAPTDQLYRLKALPGLELVNVEFGRYPHDAASLLECHVIWLEVTAFNARRGLELAALAFGRIANLMSLIFAVHAPAMIPWDCSWLSDAHGLRQLTALGVYPWPQGAREALRSARHLELLIANPNEGGDFFTETHPHHDDEVRTWQRELQAALPETKIHPWSWNPSLAEVERRWAVVGVDDRQSVSATVTKKQLAALGAPVRDAPQLLRLLERWNPTLRHRVSAAPVTDGVRLQAPTIHDLAFIQELLTLGTPDEPDAYGSANARETEIDVGSRDDNAAVHRFVDAFLTEVADGALPDNEAAAARWVEGMHSLQATGIETLGDTAVRQQLVDALRQPLADAGIDAEYVVLSF